MAGFGNFKTVSVKGTVFYCFPLWLIIKGRRKRRLWRCGPWARRFIFRSIRDCQAAVIGIAPQFVQQAGQVDLPKGLPMGDKGVEVGMYIGGFELELIIQVR